MPISETRSMLSPDARNPEAPAEAVEARSPSAAGPTVGPILNVSPGGLEHGGGIGRMIGYFRGALPADLARRVEIVDSRGGGHVVWSPFHTLRTIGRLAARRAEAPLAHIHIAGRASTLRKIAICTAARALGVPYILHLHDFNYRRFYRMMPAPIRAGMRSIFQNAVRVIVLGSDDAAMMRDVLGVDAGRVVIFHNAVPDPGIVAAEPAGKPGEPIHILFLGRLSQRKGVPDLIAAFQRPALKGLHWRATLAGDGDIETYRQQASRSGVADRLAFPGWLDRPRTDALLREADILVLPSYEEGMAMSVLEGMAYGLCVVGTHAGALAEVLVDGVNARVVQAGEVDEIAAALAETVADRALRARLGSGARDSFRRGFSAAAYGERLARLYRELGA